jgi:hypothetical protein
MAQVEGWVVVTHCRGPNKGVVGNRVGIVPLLLRQLLCGGEFGLVGGWVSGVIDGG